MTLPLNPQRILAIHVARIGDTILTSPSLRALSQRYPQATIDFLGHPKRYMVLQHLLYLAQVGTISKRSAPLRGHRFFRARPYDLAVVWGHDQSLIRFAGRMAGAVVASRQQDESLNRSLAACVDLVQTYDAPLASWYFKLLQLGLGLTEVDPRPDYRISPEEADWAQRYIQRWPNKTLIGLVTSTFPTASYRDWPVAHFVHLVTLLLQRYDHLQFVHFGTPGSCPQPLKELLQDNLHDFTGSLRQSAALIARMNLYIGLDTGPTHIAGALGIPMVVMFHCLPRNRSAFILRPRDPQRVILIDHPETTRCTKETSMDAISPQVVFTAATTLLDKFSAAVLKPR